MLLQSTSDRSGQCDSSIDKLSIFVTVAFSYIVFHEKLSLKSGTGLLLIVAGTLALLI